MFFPKLTKPSKDIHHTLKNMVIGFSLRVSFCVTFKSEFASHFTYTYKQCVYCWFVSVLHLSHLGHLNIKK